MSGGPGGLEEKQWREKIISLKKEREVERFLTDEWSLYDRDPIPSLMKWISDQNEWWKANLPAWQRAEIFRWMITFIERLKVPPSSKPELYRFFRTVATRPYELPSSRTWALRGMRIMAHADGLSDQRELFQIITQLWEGSLQWKGAMATAVPIFQRDLLETAKRLLIREARDWAMVKRQEIDSHAGVEEDAVVTTEQILDGNLRIIDVELSRTLFLYAQDRSLFEAAQRDLLSRLPKGIVFEVRMIPLKDWSSLGLILKDPQLGAEPFNPKNLPVEEVMPDQVKNLDPAQLIARIYRTRLGIPESQHLEATLFIDEKGMAHLRLLFSA